MQNQEGYTEKERTRIVLPEGGVTLAQWWQEHKS